MRSYKAQFKKLQLYFTAGSLNVFLRTTINEGRDLKASAVTDVISKELGLQQYSKSAEDFKKELVKDVTFQPYGDFVAGWNDDKFVLFKCTFQTTGFTQFFKRMQCAFAWFVETDDSINTNDSKLTVFIRWVIMVHEKCTRSEAKY